jgi:hypothetical protein
MFCNLGIGGGVEVAEVEIFAIRSNRHHQGIAVGLAWAIDVGIQGATVAHRDCNIPFDG